MHPSTSSTSSTSRTRRSRLARLAVAGAALAAVAAPGTASAGVVGWDDPWHALASTHLEYLDMHDASANDLRITKDGKGTATKDDDTITFHDATDVVTLADYDVTYSPAFTQCTSIDAHTVRCQGDAVLGLRVWSGPGDDTIRAQGDLALHAFADTGMDRIFGGAGADELDGGPGVDAIEGGEARDSLKGGTDGDILDGGDGNDDVLGEGGDDVLTGGSGADTLTSGPGTDHVSYSTRWQGVRADADGEAGDDGRQGEGDTISFDTEGLMGGHAADVLIGNALPNKLRGGDGDDELRGLAGADWLKGGEGDDTLTGFEDDDALYGDGGDDRLYGWWGRDILDGGSGIDLLWGAEGDDWLAAKDGTADELVDCREGTGDQASVDAADPVKDCETVTQP